jgi:hypothetical protein
MICINKLWYVFLAVILLNGCEKKIAFPAQIQVETFIQDNYAVSDVVGSEEGNALSAEVIKVGLTIKYDPPSKDRVVYVNQNVTEVKFFKVLAIGIEGLGQLEFLETIVFTYASELTDFSFLTEVPHLKKLFINYNMQNIDWSFIEHLTELEVLHVESYRQPQISIDLKNNKYLEYIGFTQGRLETFPTLYNVPDSLKYLNLEVNNITSLPVDFNMYSHATVFLYINPFKANATTPSNIIMEWASNIVEQKYRIHDDWSSTSSFSDLDK